VSTKAGQVQRPAASDPPRWARLAGQPLLRRFARRHAQELLAAA